MSPTVSGLVNAKDVSISAQGRPARGAGVPSNVGEIFMGSKDASSRLQQGGQGQVITVNQAKKANNKLGSVLQLRGL